MRKAFVLSGVALALLLFARGNALAKFHDKNFDGRYVCSGSSDDDDEQSVMFLKPNGSGGFTDGKKILRSVDFENSTLASGCTSKAGTSMACPCVYSFFCASSPRHWTRLAALTTRWALWRKQWIWQMSTTIASASPKSIGSKASFCSERTSPTSLVRRSVCNALLTLRVPKVPRHSSCGRRPVSPGCSQDKIGVTKHALCSPRSRAGSPRVSTLLT
jgi:hypothetical protein